MFDRKDFIRVVHTQTSRGVIDLVAVERAVNETAPEGMTGHELYEAARILAAHGVGATTISTQLRVSVATLRRWFPAELAPEIVDRSPITCGSVRGYRRHHRNGETPCSDCRAANTANDYARRRRMFGEAA